MTSAVGGFPPWPDLIAAMGLLPDNAHVSGSIEFAGRELVGLSDAGFAALRGDLVSMIFQEPMTALDPTMRVGRQVAEVLRLHGRAGSPRPWAQEERVRFVCPVPGYDRHFTLLGWFGIDTVTVPMNDDGPDAEAVALVQELSREKAGVSA